MLARFNSGNKDGSNNTDSSSAPAMAPSPEGRGGEVIGAAVDDDAAIAGESDTTFPDTTVFGRDASPKVTSNEAAAPDAASKTDTMEKQHERVNKFLATFGRPSVYGYPYQTPCNFALSAGGRCVLGYRRHACKEGLVCMRWKPGVGRCHPPRWLGSGGVYEGDIFQASAGCITTGDTPHGGAAIGTSVVPRSPPQGSENFLISPPPPLIQASGSHLGRALKPSPAPPIEKPFPNLAFPSLHGVPKPPPPPRGNSRKGDGGYGKVVARLRAFIQQWPAIPGYPADVPCKAALPSGGRCVLGQARSACQTGLVCFRWKAGHGQCRLPAWLGTAGVSTIDVFQASFGCVAPKQKGPIK
jgi:hypothetical protein